MQLFVLIFGLFLPILVAADWFQNADQQAFAAFQQQRYEEAAQLFNDPYQQGVSWYRAGKYADAEKAFAQVTQPEKQADAQYNLGNVYAKQEQYDKAVRAYQNAVQAGQNDPDVIHNLQLAKRKIAQQQQNQSNQADQSDKQQDQKKDSSDKSQSAQSKQNSQAGQKQDKQTANESKSSQSGKSDSTPPKPPNSQKDGQDRAEVPKNANTPNKMPPNQPNPDSHPASNANPAPSKPEDKQLAQPTPAKSEKAAAPSKAQAAAGNSEQIQKDMLADAWLNQVEENSEQLLRNQFKIDQWFAQQKQVATPEQDW